MWYNKLTHALEEDQACAERITQAQKQRRRGLFWYLRLGWETSLFPHVNNGKKVTSPNPTGGTRIDPEAIFLSRWSYYMILYRMYWPRVNPPLRVRLSRKGQRIAKFS
ncbi:hypothetical protein AVEN_86818-1 [Araneus ventricosus]|uniref:Uncharacterized protein n=1 Tax=Araneus ventricosus TaxID=182803 RepID=A0A4Y2D305_ARAVE|nr:hypothetical protein AVEN_86818-1 [Araneus ventricosus]